MSCKISTIKSEGLHAENLEFDSWLEHWDSSLSSVSSEPSIQWIIGMEGSFPQSIVKRL
jgi:hypothetical protein